LAASTAELRQTDLVLLGTLAFGWGSSHLGMSRTLSALSTVACLLNSSFDAGKDNPAALAASNAKLRQTDLVSELLGTLAFGWGSSQLGMSRTLGVLTTVTFLALPLELFCLRRVRSQPFNRRSSRAVCRNVVSGLAATTFLSLPPELLFLRQARSQSFGQSL